MFFVFRNCVCPASAVACVAINVMSFVRCLATRYYMLIGASPNSSFEDRLCEMHNRNLHHSGVSESDNPGANNTS